MMKLERAQEIYSDYAEDAVSPAMKLALEQHFEADPQAQRDYHDFSWICSLLSETSQQEVEIPQGFRARVLERAAAEAVRRSADPTNVFATVWRNLLLQPRRREATGILVGVFATAIVFGAFLKPGGMLQRNNVSAPTTGSIGSVPLETSTAVEPSVPSAVIRGVTIRNVGGAVYHDFDLHLTPDIGQAKLNAYLITSTEQILDPTVRQQDAAPLLSAPKDLPSDVDFSIPVGVTQQPEPGSTLNVLVEWKGDGPNGASGAEIAFTPCDASGDQGSPAAPAAGGNFFGSLQAIAADYNVTVIADASLAPVTPVGAWSTSDSVDTALETVANSAGYAVKDMDNGAYFLYRPIH